MLRTLPGILIGLSSAAAAQDIYDISEVKTIEITAPISWRTTMANNYATKALIKVDVKFDGKTYVDVGARHRGFSSYRFLPAGKNDKRPWKLVFDEFVPDQRVAGYRTLNLNNNIWDPSMMREVAGYEFMRRFLPAPKCCFVRVVVNGDDLGIFTNTQQINKDFLQEHARTSDGNRYRGDRTSFSTSWNDTALTWLGTSVSRYQAAYKLKTDNGAYPPWTNLIDSIDVLNNTATANLPAAIPKKLDVDNALRFVAVANMTGWLDSYLGRTCKNFYIYDDPYHGQLRMFPWDLNNGFGGLTDGLGQTGVARIPPFFRENDPQYPRPLFGQLMQVTRWRAAYLAHLRTMEREFRWAKLGPRIDALRQFLRPFLQADTKRIYSMQQFDDNLTRSVNVGFVTVPGLQPFIQQRNSYHATHPEMIKRAPSLADLSHTPRSPTASDKVWVNVRVSGAAPTDVTLYHRERGPFAESPMFDDGLHHDGGAGDGVFGAAIPAKPHFAIVDYYVSANNDLARGGAMAFVPATGSFGCPRYRIQGATPVGPIIISEFLAKNDNGLRDPNGDRDDWIELANIGSSAVDVSGMYLTDNIANPTKWKIPTTPTLQPLDVLLIWADGETNHGPHHANFKLSASGEELAMFAKDGKTNLDWIEFGQQLPDVSAGRLPHQLTFEVSFPTPTPDEENSPMPCGHLQFGSSNTSAVVFDLAGQGQPKLLSGIEFVMTRAPTVAQGVLFVGAPQPSTLPGVGEALLDPLVLLPLQPFLTDAVGTGKVAVTIPNLPVLAGQTFYTQAVAGNGSAARLSNGLMTKICN